MEVTRVS